MATMTRAPKTVLLSTLAAAILAGAILAVDLSLPLGVAGGVPYVAVVLLAGWTRDPRYILTFAAVTSLLTTIGYVFSPEGGVVWMVLANRALALFAIWTTAFLVAIRLKAENTIRARGEVLEDQIAHRTADIRKANVRLLENQERWRLASMAAGIGTWSRTIPDDVVAWDESTEAIFKLDPSTFEGTMEAFIALVHPDDRAKIAEGHARLLEEGIPYLTEYRAILPDGSIRIIETGSSLVREQDGSSRKIVGMLRDVTEHKRRESVMLRNERLVALGQLTGTVAHELRNPLGVVKNSIAVIRKKTAAAELDVESTMDRAERGIQRCDTIITELLDFTRAVGVRPVPTDLNAWLRGVVTQHDIPPEVHVTFNLEANGGVVRFDPHQLVGAVINVVENACQAMRGEPCDERAAADAELSIATRRSDGRIEIAIADSGPGIPEEVMPEIMEPLFSTKSFGTGLGLPTAKRILEEHGGGMEIRNRRGGGAEVVLWLPPDGAAAEAAE
jgi:PAS domain S-box-containing protein